MGIKVDTFTLKRGNHIHNSFDGIPQGFYIVTFIKNGQLNTHGYLNK